MEKDLIDAGYGTIEHHKDYIKMSLASTYGFSLTFFQQS
jgi:hypothetical protein